MGDSTVALGRQYYASLPNVQIAMEGGFSRQPHNVDLLGDTKRSHFEQEFNWSINEEHQEFVIRITRKPEAASVNFVVKIEGGLSDQPDGSEVFDGNGGGNGMSTFGLTFKVAGQSGDQPNSQQTDQTADSSGDPNSQQAWMSQTTKNAYRDPNWDQQARTVGQAYWNPSSQQAWTEGQAYSNLNSQQAWTQNAPLYSQGCYGLDSSMQSLSLQYSSFNQTFMSYLNDHNDTCSERYRCNPCSCARCSRLRLCSELPSSSCHCSQCQNSRKYS